MTSRSCFPVQENELECLWPLNCQNSLKEEERICQIEKAIGILKTAQAMRLKGLRIIPSSNQLKVYSSGIRRFCNDSLRLTTFFKKTMNIKLKISIIAHRTLLQSSRLSSGDKIFSFFAPWLSHGYIYSHFQIA